MQYDYNLSVKVVRVNVFGTNGILEGKNGKHHVEIYSITIKKQKKNVFRSKEVLDIFSWLYC